MLSMVVEGNSAHFLTKTTSDKQILTSHHPEIVQSSQRKTPKTGIPSIFNTVWSQQDFKNINNARTFQDTISERLQHDTLSSFAKDK